MIALVLARLGVGAFTAAAVGWLGYRFAVPRIVQREYRRHMPHHRFAPPDKSSGAGADDIVYRWCTFDCRTTDLLVRGAVPDAPYWQIGLYDGYARRIEGAHLNHRSVPTRAGRFEIRVTADPGPSDGVLRCADAPVGIMVLRVLRPVTELGVVEIVEVPRPPAST